MKRSSILKTNTQESYKGKFDSNFCKRNSFVMKGLVWIFVLVMGGFSVFAAQGDDIKKEVKGVWQYKAPEAPDGYQSGKIEFFEKEGQPQVKIFTDYEIINAKSLKIVKRQVIFDFYVDYEYCKVILVLKNGLFSGKVETSMGEIPVSMKRKEKK